MATALAIIMASVLGISVTSNLFGGIGEMFASMFNLFAHGGDFPAPFHQGAIWLGKQAAVLNWFLPVDTAISLLYMSYNILIYMLIFYILKMFVNWIRGVSTFNRL